MNNTFQNKEYPDGYMYVHFCPYCIAEEEDSSRPYFAFPGASSKELHWVNCYANEDAHIFIHTQTSSLCICALLQLKNVNTKAEVQRNGKQYVELFVRILHAYGAAVNFEFALSTYSRNFLCLIRATFLQPSHRQNLLSSMSRKSRENGANPFLWSRT